MKISLAGPLSSFQGFRVNIIGQKQLQSHSKWVDIVRPKNASDCVTITIALKAAKAFSILSSHTIDVGDRPTSTSSALW